MLIGERSWTYTQSTITPGVHLTFKIAGLKKVAVSKVLENLDKPDKCCCVKGVRKPTPGERSWTCTQSTITPGVHLTFKIAGLKKVAVSKVLENLDKPDKCCCVKGVRKPTPGERSWTCAQSTITPGVHLTFKIAGLKKVAVSKVLENLDKPDKCCCVKGVRKP